jgi:hypothetical protein
MVIRNLALWLSAIVLIGCGTAAPTTPMSPKAVLDQQVEEDLASLEQRPAVQLLQNGGKHYESEGPESATADKEVLLPLCQRLESEFHLQPIALLDDDDADKKAIYYVAVKLTSDAVAKSAIQAAIREADQPFPGKIEAEWGEHWLILTLQPPDELD